MIKFSLLSLTVFVLSIVIWLILALSCFNHYSISGLADIIDDVPYVFLFMISMFISVFSLGGFYEKV